MAKAKFDPSALPNWMEESLGVPLTALFNTFKNDDDWTFVIKIHAIIEAALNQILITQMGNPSLDRIIEKLETNNRRTGKIAFIRAYDLLPDKACLFIRLLSEIRNDAVHDARNFGLNLNDYARGLSKENRANWKAALTYPFVGVIDVEAVDRSGEEYIGRLRDGISFGCVHLLVRALNHHREASKRLIKELVASELNQSTPKE